MGDTDRVWFSADLPAGFPTRNRIVRSCDRAGFNRNGVYIQVEGKPRYWVKYGRRSLIRSEGRTQARVAGVVNANPANAFRIPHVYLGFSRGKRGYIVMDFVLGATIAQRKLPNGSYDKKDIKAVAAAVQQLIDIRMPANTAPGPFGGGLIGHDFFVESLSSITYPSVAHLEAQINEVLRLSQNNLRVDFQTETANGLVLCPSDPNDSNFIIDEGGTLWAIDFGRTSFLPPSFVSYSLRSSSDRFVQSIASHIICPMSANLPAMWAASGMLVIFNDNTLGAVQPPSGSIARSDCQTSLAMSTLEVSQRAIRVIFDEIPTEHPLAVMDARDVADRMADGVLC
uniref:Protein kinase domain-containing protein n=1 Tax=Ganoderma boninense TaxID=34458 RepID=A0A5K1K173_9APHY|nr:Protein kinase domain-containing protein [Ganoderma boninense]